MVLRLLFFGALSVFLAMSGSGCASYRPVNMWYESVDPASATVNPELKPGTEVRVTLRTGEVISGRIVALTAQQLVLRRSGYPQTPDLSIARTDVVAAETGHGVRSGYVALGVVAFVALGVVSFMVVMSAAAESVGPF